MSKEKGHFKGRVVAVEGTKIIIDTKADAREIVDKLTGKRTLVAAWDKSDMPKPGDIVRGIFRKRRR